MKVLIKTVIVFALTMMLQTALADNRPGHGRDSFSKPQKFQKAPSRPAQIRKPTSRPVKSRPAPPSRQSRFGHDHYRQHDYYRPGYGIRYLPHGFFNLFVGNTKFFYYDGYFYQPYRNEYRIVEAPIGAIVLSLPRLHFSLQWNGIEFFVAGNTYYRRHPRGYIVVPNPGFRDDWR